MEKEYYLGLDIGTNSVGYAVTDKEYNLLKFKGEPMWGSHVFEEASQSADRRAFRTARRRLNRRQQRIRLTQEIFAREMAKIDDKFFIRLQESALFPEDTSLGENRIFPMNSDYTDKQYHKDYPTIHHLILDLMKNDSPHDVRLVYLAVSWLMAHRGHFLNEVGKDSIEAVLDFDTVYERLLFAFAEAELVQPWNVNKEIIKDILLMDSGIKAKEDAFKERVFGGKKPKTDENTVIALDMVAKLLSGGTVEAQKLYLRREFEEKISINFRKSEEEIQLIFMTVNDETGLLEAMKQLYDWSLLYKVTGGGKCISENMVKKYNIHKTDLMNLKKFIKKYVPDKYNEIFREQSEGLANYVAYSYNVKNCNTPIEIKKKASKEVFSDWLKKQVEVKDISALSTPDTEFYEDMMERLNRYDFLPKQVDGDNRVIPYQLYYYELKQILDQASKYLLFLNEKDADGYINKQKILDLFTFRVPYYVGPLHPSEKGIAWIKRKDKTGTIRPWNFEDKVDLLASEDAFIQRMTNTCSYIANEPVLPKNSLLYEKYSVLNEINNIKVNGVEIPVECKQLIYHIFEEKRKVTRKMIEGLLMANRVMNKDSALEGIDININSSLKSYHDFKRLLNSKCLNTNDVENIISRLTYSEDKNRIRKWLEMNYPTLSGEDVKYISKLKYNDFGRLSRRLLAEIAAPDKTTGEGTTIIRALWETNNNLMQLLTAEDYGFKEALEDINRNYYDENPATVDSIMDDLYVSNAVKRPIYRTLSIVKDVVKATGTAPKRIFVEMARGKEENPQRTKTRRQKLEDMYKVCPIDEVRELSKLLESKTDNELQSEVLFLYFTQLGKCMYSGKSIDIERLKKDTYVNVDHIYPQAYVKDDSIDNKVLVMSELNGQKGDKYPISNDIRGKMLSFWSMLHNQSMISDEKYKRLTRNTAFTDDEKREFINRQLVETRQSTKAVTKILGVFYPDTEIVYVKAGLVSSFRHEYSILKCRSINDLHHAKDAYLNIVCGNVYHSKFTKNFAFNVGQDYSLKTKTVFNNSFALGKEVIWNGQTDIAKIKKIVKKNNIHFTRFTFVRKGGLFDQNPVKASDSLVQRKKGLDTSKYGGYNKPSATYFLLTKYTEMGKKPNTDIMIMAVDLMQGNNILRSEETASEYAKMNIANILNKSCNAITDISFPLGLRPLKINTVIRMDSMIGFISGKSNGGITIGMSSALPLILSGEDEEYIKRLERFCEKKKHNTKIVLNEEYDGINRQKNLDLYITLINKVVNGPFKNAFGSKMDMLLLAGENKFKIIETDKQVNTLINLVLLLKSGRAGTVDLSTISDTGASKVGSFRMNSKLSNWCKSISYVEIIDETASGLFSSKSGNLLELL